MLPLHQASRAALVLCKSMILPMLPLAVVFAAFLGWVMTRKSETDALQVLYVLWILLLLPVGWAVIRLLAFLVSA